MGGSNPWRFGSGEEGDKRGAVVRVRGAAGEPSSGWEPRRLLPPRPQRTGRYVSIYMMHACSTNNTARNDDSIPIIVLLNLISLQLMGCFGYCPCADFFMGISFWGFF